MRLPNETLIDTAPWQVGKHYRYTRISQPPTQWLVVSVNNGGMVFAVCPHPQDAWSLFSYRKLAPRGQFYERDQTDEEKAIAVRLVLAEASK